MQKTLFLWITCIGIILLSSCTESDDIRYSSRCGLVKLHTTGNKLFYFNDEDLPVYHEILEDHTENEALWAEFRVNRDSEDNANASQRGYMIAETFHIRQGNINRESAIYTNIDTEKKLKNEVTTAMIDLYGFVEEHLFLMITNTNIPQESTLYYRLELDTAQEPKVHSIYNINVYDIYIRVTTDETEGGTTHIVNQLQGFDLAYPLYLIKDYEKTKNNKAFFLRLNFVNTFKNETVERWTEYELGAITI